MRDRVRISDGSELVRAGYDSSGREFRKTRTRLGDERCLLMRSEICRLLWRQEVQRNPLVPACGSLPSDRTHDSSRPKSVVSTPLWRQGHLVNAECL